MTMISRPNPFRLGSQLSGIFTFMADGEWHTLPAIVEGVYSYAQGIGNSRVWRRRIGSALRTIRATPGLHVECLLCVAANAYEYRLADTMAGNWL